TVLRIEAQWQAETDPYRDPLQPLPPTRWERIKGRLKNLGYWIMGGIILVITGLLVVIIGILPELIRWVKTFFQDPSRPLWQKALGGLAFLLLVGGIYYILQRIDIRKKKEK
ncbi:MAG: hypothetical protein D6732_28510, partial [Methanobacteriota archaeon]